jgi:hypothetical protein
MSKTGIRYAVALAGFWVAFAGWAISSPVGSSPDDDFHLGSIWCAGGYEFGVCQDNGKGMNASEKSVLIPVFRNFCYTNNSSLSGKCFEGEPPAGLQQFRENQNSYPKLFYKIQHIFVGEDSFLSVYIMRLFNATLAVLVFGLALFLGRPELRIGLVAAWTFTLVPLGMFIIPSTNPSSWTFTGIATNWMFQMSAMRSSGNNDSRAFLNWFMYVLTAAMCVGSRSDAAVYLIFSTIVVTLNEFSQGTLRKLRSIFLPFVVCSVATLSILSTSQGRNFAEAAVHRDEPGFNRLVYNTIHFIEIPAGALGVNYGLGWLDTILPPIVGICGVSLFAITIYNALSIGELRRTLSLAAIVGFAYLMVVMILNEGNFVVGEIVQPRYILPLLPLIVGIVSADNATFDETIRRRKWQFTFISILTVTQSISIYTNVRRYVTGLDMPFLLNLDVRREWWSQSFISPNFTFLVSSISFSIFLFFVWRSFSYREEIDSARKSRFFNS